MRKVVIALVLVMSLFTLSAMAGEWTGYISDSKCGAKHAAAAEADMKCVQSCVRRGEAPVLISGDKVYTISADSKDKVMSKLGQKVTVNAKVSGDTIVTPEPGTLGLLGTGLVGIAGLVRRKFKAA